MSVSNKNQKRIEFRDRLIRYIESELNDLMRYDPERDEAEHARAVAALVEAWMRLCATSAFGLVDFFDKEAGRVHTVGGGLYEGEVSDG